jgi:hypothetical protein
MKSIRLDFIALDGECQHENPANKTLSMGKLARDIRTTSTTWRENRQPIEEFEGVDLSFYKISFLFISDKSQVHTIHSPVLRS